MAYLINRSALVNFSAQQMFDLVNDIEAYPQYMEGCVSATILQRQDDWLEARLDLKRAGVRQSFVTRNHLKPPESMTMTLVDGPFSYLHGCWRFTALNATACKVSFDMEFELENKLLGLAIGKLFESVAGNQVDALCVRAQQIYGS